MRVALLSLAAAMLVLAGLAPAARAEEAGHIKVVKGTVQIERIGQKLPATGGDGSVGITFLDNSLLSAGPNSVLVIDRFVFDTTTHQGAFESSLQKGTLAVVSGKLAKASPDSMKVKTPATVLGVRGTEFLVRTGDGKE